MIDLLQSITRSASAAISLGLEELFYRSVNFAKKNFVFRAGVIMHFQARQSGG